MGNPIKRGLIHVRAMTLVEVERDEEATLSERCLGHFCIVGGGWHVGPVSTSAASRQPRAINFEFQQIQCRCGIDRIRGSYCVDCGALPDSWEVDLLAQRRRIGASELASGLESEPVGHQIGPVEFGLSDHFGQLSAWLDSVLDGLANFAAVTTPGADLDRSQAALRSAVLEISQLRADLRATPALRPNLIEHAVLSETVERLVTLTSHYLAALRSPTPIEAQRRGEAAQRELDLVVEQLDVYCEYLDTFAPFMGSSKLGDLAAASIKTSLVDWQCDGPIELNETAEDALTRLIGVTPPEGVALEYALTRSMAAYTMDVLRFDGIIRSLYRLLAGNPEALQALSAEGVFLDDVQNRLNDFRESLYSTQVVLANSESSSSAARQIVQLMGSLYEGAGHLVMNVWAIASGTRTRPYSKLRHDNASDIHEALLRQDEVGSFLVGLDAHIRLAWAHSKVLYGSNSVAFETRSRGTKDVPYSELFDTAFALIELVAGSFIGIRCALGDLGIQLDEWDPITESLDPAARLQLGAEIWASEGTTIKVEVDTPESIVSFEGRVSADPRSVAGTLTSYVDSELVRTLVVTFSDPRTSYAMDVHRYQRWSSEADEDVRSMLFVAMCLTSTREGVPLLSKAEARVWVARAVGERLSDDLGSNIRALRAFRVSATAFEDPLIETVLSGTIRYLRESAMGEISDDTAFEQLKSWIGH